MPQLPPALKNLLIVMALFGLAQIALPNIGTAHIQSQNTPMGL